MFLRFSDEVCKYSHFSRNYNIFHPDGPIYQFTAVIPRAITVIPSEATVIPSEAEESPTCGLSFGIFQTSNRLVENCAE